MVYTSTTDEEGIILDDLYFICSHELQHRPVELQHQHPGIRYLSCDSLHRLHQGERLPPSRDSLYHQILFFLLVLYSPG